MEVLLILNDGLRVVLKLHTESLREEFTDLLTQGRKEEVVQLLKSKAEFKAPVLMGREVPSEFKPFLIIKDV